MLKVMIAENDPMIAGLVKDALVQHGYEVCGIARTVAEGVALGRRHKPDLAVLDMLLSDGGLGTDIASQLDHSRLGILYAAGDISQVLLCAADGDACISKPYRSEDLLRAVDIVAAIAFTGIASPPFPHGFQLLDGAVRIRVFPTHRGW